MFLWRSAIIERSTAGAGWKRRLGAHARSSDCVPCRKRRRCTSGSARSLGTQSCESSQIVPIAESRSTGRPLNRGALSKRSRRNWVNDETLTRTGGDQWLASKRSLLLRVPSAIAPETLNVLLNSAHEDARRLRIVSHREYPWVCG